MKWILVICATLLGACSTASGSQALPTNPPTVENVFTTSVVTPTQTPPTWWQPEPGTSWQIQFTGEIDTSLDVDLYDLDLFETSVEQIDALHARGKHVICYVNAGAWEDWRPDAADFPAEVLGADYTGWPGERWLDISDLDALAPIMQARLDLCAAKRFDGVDPDNLDGFTNETGFDLDAADAIGYAQWLAAEAHARGLAIGVKNVPELVADLGPHFDWALLESCFAQGWCGDLQSFIENSKPVFAIEYIEAGMSLEGFCTAATEMGFSAILKTRELDSWVEFCP